MFDYTWSMEASSLNAADLAGWIAVLGDLSVEAGDGERIDRIRVLEDLKGAIAAAQAREAVALKRSVIAAEAAQGVPAEQQGRGVAAQVALARRESPHRGGRLLGLAEALVKELPRTLALLGKGEVSEWRATLVCRETACLSRADRARVDQLLAAALPSLSDRQVIAQARRHSYRLDPASFVERCAKAEADRRVSIRPAPDAMALISALLPVSEGVAAYAALVRAADSARASGDARSRGQLMADTLVTRVTGQTQADQVPMEVQLVLSANSLLHGDPEAATIPGYGPIPAGHALRLL